MKTSGLVTDRSDGETSGEVARSLGVPEEDSLLVVLTSWTNCAPAPVTRAGRGAAPAEMTTRQDDASTRLVGPRDRPGQPRLGQGAPPDLHFGAAGRGPRVPVGQRSLLPTLRPPVCSRTHAAPPHQQVGGPDRGVDGERNSIPNWGKLARPGLVRHAADAACLRTVDSGRRRILHASWGRSGATRAFHLSRPLASGVLG